MIDLLKIERNKKILIFVIPILLLIFIIYAMIPFISALFGTIILFAIFLPVYNWLTKKLKMHKILAAWIIIILSLLVVILPMVFLIQGLIDQMTILPSQISKIGNLEEKLNQNLAINISLDEQAIVNEIVPLISKSLGSILSNAISVFASLFLMYFLLYYLLLNSDYFFEIIKSKSPYNEESSKHLVKKFMQITYATIIGTFFIGIIQGGLLAISFYMVGIPNALFWGFIGVILSFIPIIGPPIIWIPAAIILFISENTKGAIIILIFGIILSNIDNILRPILNKKFGKIHPVVSIIGLFIGITQFGFVGIFVGPLIVAYFIILWKIYKEESK